MKSKYTDWQIAVAKAAIDCGVKSKVVARRLDIPVGYLYSGILEDKPIPADPGFIEKFNALFGETQ